MKSVFFGSCLLLSSALVAPEVLAQASIDLAEDAGAQVPDVESPDESIQPDGLEQPPTEEVDISGPIGGLEEIVVRGKFIPDVVRANPVVVSVLSSAQIERTGDGDIAGALKRVTGLSLVGGRFVYVRGLGERYSQALLNGLPLPSPEPLRRVVPLDIFPSSIIASSAVQKTYSPGFPGEFGGGAINLTTKTAPDEPFLNIGITLGGNTQTTGELGYTHFGSGTDWTGFDDGTRDVPDLLQDAFDTGQRIVLDPGAADGSPLSREGLTAITQSLENASTNLIQSNDNIPIDGAFDITGATSFDVGDETKLGVFFNFGWDNQWRTRGGTQQLSGDVNLTPGSLARDFDYLTTLNRIVVNGALGFTAEIGEHTLRWTNLYIRDSLKETQISVGETSDASGVLQNIGQTAWFERQLIDTQFVGEFRFDDWGIDVRGTYAEAQRNSPYERQNTYVFNALVDDFVMPLSAAPGQARIAFSELTDEVFAGGIDAFYNLNTERPMKVTVGYAYLDNTRDSFRRDFSYLPVDGIGLEISQQRPDFLLSDFNIANSGILLNESTGGVIGAAPAYEAGLEVNAAFVQLEAEFFDGFSITTGLRYEDATQFVDPVATFTSDQALIDAARAGATNGVVFTQLDNDYFLPSITATYNFYDDMQIRIAASRTIARPQFRELAPQFYVDPDVDRTFRGNQFLEDSELLNFDIRYEWYFGRDERFTVSGFYKDIDNPIESSAVVLSDSIQATYANAPSATLFGAEIEVEKYFDLYDLTENTFFADRRIYLNANYTYTESSLQVNDTDRTITADAIVVGGVPQTQLAQNIFVDGAPLTGQSKHLANLQIGLEHPDYLSQQTLILNYASNRVSLRGINRGGSGLQPDVIERPGVILDFVARQGIELGGTMFEVSLEARNLLNADFRETQSNDENTVIINQFERGRSFSISFEAQF